MLLILSGCQEPPPDPGRNTFWISPDGSNELIQVQLEPSPGNTVTMTLSKWGESVTVDNPAP